MKILFITPFKIEPADSGATVRIFNIIKYLGKNNIIKYFFHNYHQGNNNFKKKICLNRVEKFSVGPSLRILQFFNPFLLFVLFKHVVMERPDCIIVSFPWAALYAILLKIFYDIPFFLDLHNIEYIRLKEQKRFLFFNWVFRIIEKSAWKYAEKIFCVSKEDMKFLENQGVSSIKLIEIQNGATDKNIKSSEHIETLQNIYLIKEKKVVLFFGNYSHAPNLYAFRKIFNHISKDKSLKNVVFILVGANPPLSKGIYDNVIVTGAVSDINDYIYLSDLLIVPLETGGGTRLKIIEMLICSKPVLSTSKGAEGIEKNFCKNLLCIENDLNLFSVRINDLLKNKIEFEISKEFKNKYTWENILFKLEKSLKKAVAKKTQHSF